MTYSNCLLEDESNDDGLPLDQLAVARAGVVDCLEDDEAENGDGPLAVRRSLRRSEAVSGPEDETEEGEPAETEASHLGELEERLRDASRPSLAERPAEDGRGDEAEEDVQDDEPGDDGLKSQAEEEAASVSAEWEPGRDRR